MRRALSWKFLFYDLILPMLRILGPVRADAVLGRLGCFMSWAIPGRRRVMIEALRRGSDALDASWPVQTLVPQLAADVARFRARDYPLDHLEDDEVLTRFKVRGATRLNAALQRGEGAILVGCHFGAHIAALHWFYRRTIPLRVFAQRPRHVSSVLNRVFDTEGPHAQADLFVRRDLDPATSARRILFARDAIRDGLAIYLNGDIPWEGNNTRRGTLLGHSRQFLSIWVDLAVLTGAPVFWVFCTHEAGGRFALDIEQVGPIRAKEEASTIDRYFHELNARIANDPTEAVAHLLWPCYTQPPATAPRSLNPQGIRSSRARPAGQGRNRSRTGWTPIPGKSSDSALRPPSSARTTSA